MLCRLLRICSLGGSGFYTGVCHVLQASIQLSVRLCFTAVCQIGQASSQQSFWFTTDCQVVQASTVFNAGGYQTAQSQNISRSDCVLLHSNLPGRTGIYAAVRQVVQAATLQSVRWCRLLQAVCRLCRILRNNLSGCAGIYTAVCLVVQASIVKRSWFGGGAAHLQPVWMYRIIYCTVLHYILQGRFCRLFDKTCTYRAALLLQMLSSLFSFWSVYHCKKIHFGIRSNNGVQNRTSW
jgi:hypothetical protein